MRKDGYETDSNTVRVSGRLTSLMEEDHTSSGGVTYYKGSIRVRRENGSEDTLPFIADGRKLIQIGIDPSDSCTFQQQLRLRGSLHSRNVSEKGKKRLEVYLYARIVTVCKEETPAITDLETENTVSLEGFLCKIPVLHRTRRGRHVVNYLFAVNRPDGRADYIPCVAWNACAEKVSRLQTGTALILHGSFQSRSYVGKDSFGCLENRTVYEVRLTEFICISGTLG